MGAHGHSHSTEKIATFRSKRLPTKTMPSNKMENFLVLLYLKKNIAKKDRA